MLVDIYEHSSYKNTVTSAKINEIKATVKSTAFLFTNLTTFLSKLDPSSDAVHKVKRLLYIFQNMVLVGIDCLFKFIVKWIMKGNS